MGFKFLNTKNIFVISCCIQELLLTFVIEARAFNGVTIKYESFIFYLDELLNRQTKYKLIVLLWEK